MNQIVFFALLISAFIRFLGVMFTIEFYLESKLLRYKVIVLGWFILLCAGFFPIISIFFQNMFLVASFLAFNAILSAVGGLFLIIGFFSYFLSLNLKKLVPELLILIFIPNVVISIFLNNLIISFSISTMFAMFSFFFLILLIRKNETMRYVKKSIKWFYALCTFMVAYISVSAFYFFKGYSFGLYDVTNNLDVIVNYFFVIGLMVFILEFFIHLEHDISSNKKNELKDKYSHNVGNILQAICNAVEIIELNKNLDEENSEMVKLIKKKVFEASDVIDDIRNL